MDSAWVEIILIFVLIVINGLFAMSEIAMVSARKVRLQQLAEDGEPSAQVALNMSKEPNRLLSTVQVGITLVSVFTGAFGGARLAGSIAPTLAAIPGLEPYSDGLALALVVLGITYFSLVIGELIPKRLGLNNPERVAMLMARPMAFLAWLTRPVVQLLSVSTEIGLRLLGVKLSKEPPITEEEIKILMDQGTQVGVFEEGEQDIVEGVFRLADRRVDAIMTPRTEVVWLNLDAPLETNMEIVLQSKHSLFPWPRATWITSWESFRPGPAGGASARRRGGFEGPGAAAAVHPRKHAGAQSPGRNPPGHAADCSGDR